MQQQLRAWLVDEGGVVYGGGFQQISCISIGINQSRQLWLASKWLSPARKQAEFHRLALLTVGIRWIHTLATLGTLGFINERQFDFIFPTSSFVFSAKSAKRNDGKINSIRSGAAPSSLFLSPD